MSETGAGALTEWLRRGFRGLRFDAELEAAWRRDQFRARARYLRINLAILAAISLVVVQVNSVVMPAIGRILPDPVLAAAVLLLFGGAFAVTFLRRADVWYPRFIAVALAAALLVMAWVGVAAWALGESRVLSRVMLAIVAVYFVLGVGFRTAVTVNAAGLVAYAAFALRADMPGDELTHALMTLLIANAICIAGAWNLEHARRTSWLDGRRLEESAHQDGLTGIHNRRRFDEHLQRVWAQCVRERKPVALLLGDIDHFKGFNDHYGHQAGDEALKAVATLLAKFARRPLDLAARYGGEEFAIILFDARPADAERVAAGVLEAVRALGIPHDASGVAPFLTISLGVACVLPAAGRSRAGLVQLADQALYAAKDGGRDRAVTLQEEYEHMRTGNFNRDAAAKDTPRQ